MGPFLHQRVLIIYPTGENKHDVKNNNELIFYEEQNEDWHLKEWKILAQRKQAQAYVALRKNFQRVSRCLPNIPPSLQFPGLPLSIPQISDLSL